MKLSAGFITYSSQKYLPYFLENLSKQSIISDCEIMCLDNNIGDSCLPIVEKSAGKFSGGIRTFQSRENLGFSRGHNFLMNMAENNLYVCINNDIVLDEYCLEHLLNTLLTYKSDNPAGKSCASAAPKLLYWDFEHNKRTNRIDSTGLDHTFYYGFYERGQLEEDIGRFDNKPCIWGVSGALALYDLDKLNNVSKAHVEGNNITNLRDAFPEIIWDKLPVARHAYREYFDDSFFMYKEDVDLAWRLNLAGYQAVFAPNALAWHDRTVVRTHSNYFIHTFKGRKTRSKTNRILSAKNHRTMLIKNLTVRQAGLLRYMSAWIYEAGKFIFSGLFERS